MKNVEIPINNRTVETVLYNRKFFAQLHGFLRMKKVAKDIARGRKCQKISCESTAVII